MKNCILAVILALTSLPAFAAEPASALQELKALAGEPAAIDSGVLVWTDNIDQLIVNGAWRLNVNGRTFYIKLGFRRGQYDAAAKTYKARAALLPFEILSTVDDITTYTMWQLGYLDDLENNYSYEFQPADGESIEIFNVDGVLEAWYNNQEHSNRIATLRLSQFYRNWEAFAMVDCLGFSGRDFCMTPQVFFDKGVIKYGVVATRDTPLHAVTGQPQDFVELFSRGDSGFSYRETAYSLPLGVTFRRGPEASGLQVWEARPMKKEEIPAAQDEVLSGRSRHKAAPSATATGRRGLK